MFSGLDIFRLRRDSVFLFANDTKRKVDFFLSYVLNIFFFWKIGGGGGGG